ncbi:MAG TPA: hypothetical protein VKJ83_07355 [Actinomycetota bacterium]|nr:hypothetical protein [Actinomycetota bacterium]
MRSFEERLREALRQRADGVVPNQPAWEDLLTRPAEPSRPGHRLWLAVATAALVVLVPFLVVARYLSRTSHVTVDGQGQLDSSPSTGSAAAGPPDGTLPTGFGPVSITRISLRAGWALGTSLCGTEVCTALARTRDAGATWHSVPVPAAVAAAGPNRISRVRFANSSDGWLFGQQVWATNDGGTSWHPVAALGGPMISLEAADGRAWGLVASTEGVSATVYTAPVGSDDWEPVGPAAPAVGITLQGKVGYAVAPDGALIALGPGPGIEERGVPCPAATVAAVAAPSDTEVAVVCAADPGAGSSTKTLLLSHNGGRTWSTAGVAPRGGQTSGLAAASTHTFVVAAASGASYLYRTIDGGKTWKTVFTDTGGGAPLKDLGFTDPTHGVVVLGATPDAKLFVSSDAGLTWKAQVFAP